MAVSITNPNKVPFVIALYHKEYCQNGGPCNCAKKAVTRHVQPYSSKGVDHPGQVIKGNKYLSKTLTIAGKTTEKGLPNAILSLSQVQEARRTKVIRCVREANPLPEKTKEPVLEVAPVASIDEIPSIEGAVSLGEDMGPRSEKRTKGKNKRGRKPKSSPKK